MICRFLWWALTRVYPCGVDVTPEMLEGINDAIREEGERLASQQG